MPEIIRCIVCDYVPTDKEMEGASRCPNCGTTSSPISSNEDIEIKINYHELRILIIWAERWASDHADTDPSMQTVLYKIARRLEKQHPERSKECPLTFLGELEQLKTLSSTGQIEQNIIQDPHPEGYGGPDFAPPVK